MTLASLSVVIIIGSVKLMAIGLEVLLFVTVSRDSAMSNRELTDGFYSRE